MTKFGGKSTRRGPIAAARKRGPVPTPKTGRTSVKGDRSGLRVPAQRDVHVSRYFDGSINTLRLPSSRDPETGKVMGVKIAPCRACGHVRLIGVATGLCGLKSCRVQRVRRHAKRTMQRRAQDWRDQITEREEASS